MSFHYLILVRFFVSSDELKKGDETEGSPLQASCPRQSDHVGLHRLQSTYLGSVGTVEAVTEKMEETAFRRKGYHIKARTNASNQYEKLRDIACRRNESLETEESSKEWPVQPKIDWTKVRY